MPTATVMTLLADLGFDNSLDSGSEIMIDTFDQWSNGSSTHQMRATACGISLNEPAKAA